MGHEPGPELREKLGRLEALLRGYGRLVVAYSGGVDSSFLAVAAHRVLGADALAVTAVSESLAPEELEEACALARRFGFAHQQVRTAELSDERFAANPPERCYFCKAAVMEQLLALAAARGATVVLGANLDDLGDFRPGERAAGERGAVFPLREAGLTKSDIRALSRAWDLPNADKPAAACLASRIPFGERISAKKLEQVARAEALLHQAGFRECRVRHHGAVARLEIPAARLKDALAIREQLVAGLKTLGFVYVTLDLAGFRSGSAHEALAKPPSA